MLHLSYSSYQAVMGHSSHPGDDSCCHLEVVCDPMLPELGRKMGIWAQYDMTPCWGQVIIYPMPCLLWPYYYPNEPSPYLVTCFHAILCEWWWTNLPARPTDGGWEWELWRKWEAVSHWSLFFLPTIPHWPPYLLWHCGRHFLLFPILFLQADIPSLPLPPADDVTYSLEGELIVIVEGRLNLLQAFPCDLTPPSRPVSIPWGRPFIQWWYCILPGKQPCVLLSMSIIILSILPHCCGNFAFWRGSLPPNLLCL